MRLFALPWTVVLLGLTSLFTDASSEMIFPLLPVFLVGTLGADKAFLGLVEGAADTVSSLLKLVSGAYSDRVARRKPIVIFGYGLASAVRPLVAVATAPWHVLAVRLADRVGKGVRGAPRDALIADAAEPGAVGRAFGFHQAMDHAGAVIGPLVATALIAVGVSMRGVFWVASIPAALAVLVLFFVRDTRRAPGPAPGPAPAPAAAAAAAPAAATAPLPSSFSSYVTILGLFSLGNSSDAFLLVRAHDLGVADAGIPLLWAVFHVVKLVSSWVGGDAADRVPRVRLIVAGWFVYAVCYFAFAVARAPWQAWAIFLVYGVYYGLTEPVGKALVKDIVPSTSRGRAFGWYNFVIGVAALPASLLTGWLWKALGPLVALGTGAALAGVSSLLLWAWSVRYRVASLAQ